jgi:hypothetical protein
MLRRTLGAPREAGAMREIAPKRSGRRLKIASARAAQAERRAESGSLKLPPRHQPAALMLPTIGRAYSSTIRRRSASRYSRLCISIRRETVRWNSFANWPWV